MTLYTLGDGTFNVSVIQMGEAAISTEALAHELGHNFGLPHASSTPCVPGSLVDPADSCGRLEEQGDMGDTMGYYPGLQHFSSAFKSLFSWFDSGQVQDVTASGEYVLDPFETSSAGAKALRIQLGGEGLGGEISYWIEYRTPSVFDQGEAVQVRLQPGALFDGNATSILKTNTVRFKGLAGAGAISGRVVRDSDGSPVQRMQLALMDSSRTLLRYATTDSEGRYAFKDLAAGRYYVNTLSSEGLANEYYDNVLLVGSASLIEVAKDQPANNVDFSLSPGSVVSGLITREADGTGVPNAIVYAYDQSWNSVVGAVADSSGHYCLQGLQEGRYYLYAYSSHGYVGNYYPNRPTRSAATLLSVGKGARLKDVDFSMTLGAAISGQVVRESDKVPLQDMWVYAFDASWAISRSARTGSDGRYKLEGLAPGTYFVGTFNSQGYAEQYYNGVTNRSAATPVQVSQGPDVGSIDFTLKPVASEVAVHEPVSSAGAIQAPNPMTQFSDVTQATPFVDPFRGVKIELLEIQGTGADARARLKVTLSGVRVDAGQTLSFSGLSLGGRQTKQLEVANKTGGAVAVGQLIVVGRNHGNFAVSKDDCSGRTLAPEASCKAEVTFAPVRYSGSQAGEFAILRIPTDDSVRSVASVDLWGNTSAADLWLSMYADSFAAGQNGHYSLYITNEGTLSTSGTITVTDRLPPGLRFVSGTNTSGWQCSANGQEVTCTNQTVLKKYYGLTLDITVAVSAEAVPICTNAATVSNPSDTNPDNNFVTVTSMVTGGPGSLYGPNLLRGGGGVTGIALSNFGTGTTALTISAFDDSGALMNVATRLLHPGEQLPLMDYELWGAPQAGGPQMSWFQVAGNTDQIFGLNLAFDQALQVLDGSTMFKTLSGPSILPEVDTRGFTRIHIGNFGSSAIPIEVELLTGGGETRATVGRRLEPRGSLAKTVQELFPTAAVDPSDYVRVVADRAITAIECIGMPGQWIRAVSAQDVEGGAATLYAPQYAAGGTDWSTSLSIINLDSTAGQVNLRLIGNDGLQIGKTVNLPISANGKLLLTDQSLFTEAGNTLVQGYLEIRGDGLRLTGSVTFGDKPGSRFSAALPLQPAVAREFLFAHAASNAIWYTGLALVNPGESGITATIQLLDRNGKPVASKTEAIAGKNRKIQLLTEYFPEIRSMDVTSGYIRVIADNPVVAFALFGTLEGSVLSAIPPQPIPF